MISISCPYPRDGKINELINNGITDFYVGIMPSSWLDRYSLICSINRRYNLKSQLTSKRDLELLFRNISNNNIKVSVVLNAKHYITEQIDYILNLAKVLVKNGINTFTISDMSLIKRMKDIFPNIEMHASCVHVCLNRSHASMLKKIGISRIIFPRSITPEEIYSIKEETNIEIEGFYSMDECPNIDGLCTHMHSPDEDIVSMPMCKLESGFFKTESNMQMKNKFITTKRTRLIEYYKAGLDYIKITGRGNNAYELISQNKELICMVKKLNEGKFE